MTPEQHDHLDEQLEKRIWTSKDGRETPVAEISNRHLENLIVWLDKRMIELEHEIEWEDSNDVEYQFIGDQDGAHPPCGARRARARLEKWVPVFNAELVRRRAEGITVADPPDYRKPNPGRDLQEKWRWNGKPLRVRVRVFPTQDGFFIGWYRWFPKNAPGQRWIEWRAYRGVGTLSEVVDCYRDYAADWRGRGDD